MTDDPLRAALDAAWSRIELDVMNKHSTPAAIERNRSAIEAAVLALAASATDEGPKSAWQQFDEEWRAEHAASAPDEGHVHEWERGVHMAAAFGVDGRTYACAICGILRRIHARRGAER